MSLATRKERDRQRREDDFLNAAEELFAQKGYHKAGIEEIAQAAQYGTGTIYRYFSTKEELYVALLERKGWQLLEFLKTRAVRTASPREQIRSLVNALTEFFQQHRAFLRLYVTESTTFRWTFHKRFLPQLERVIQATREYFRETFAACMRPDGLRDMDSAKLAAVFSGMVDRLLLEALREDGDQAMEKARLFLLELLEQGFMRTGSAAKRP